MLFGWHGAWQRVCGGTCPGESLGSRASGDRLDQKPGQNGHTVGSAWGSTEALVFCVNEDCFPHGTPQQVCAMPENGPSGPEMVRCCQDSALPWATWVNPQVQGHAVHPQLQFCVYHRPLVCSASYLCGPAPTCLSAKADGPPCCTVSVPCHTPPPPSPGNQPPETGRHIVSGVWVGVRASLE